MDLDDVDTTVKWNQHRLTSPFGIESAFYMKSTPSIKSIPLMENTSPTKSTCLMKSTSPMESLWRATLKGHVTHS